MQQLWKQSVKNSIQGKLRWLCWWQKNPTFAKEHKKYVKAKSKYFKSQLIWFERFLLAPYCQKSTFYYSGKLKKYNLTVTYISNMETYYFIWMRKMLKKGDGILCRLISCKIKKNNLVLIIAKNNVLFLINICKLSCNSW